MQVFPHYKWPGDLLPVSCDNTVTVFLILFLNVVINKIIVFLSDLACSVAGITSDANVLTNQLRLIAQRYSTFCNYTTVYMKFYSVFLLVSSSFFSVLTKMNNILSSDIYYNSKKQSLVSRLLVRCVM